MLQPDLLHDISVYCADGGARLHQHFTDKNATSDEAWIARLHQALKTVLIQPGAKDLPTMRAHSDGARITLGEILRHLGPKSELLIHRHNIQIQARLYLGWLGFRDANRVLVNSCNREPEAFSSPEEIHTHYRCAVYILHALRALLGRIADGKEPPLNAEQQLGTLVVLLMLRNGAVSLAELRMALTEIAAGRIAKADTFWYIVGPIAPDNRHIRRTYLTPATVVAALSWAAVDIPKQAFTRKILAGLEALSNRLSFPEPRPALSYRTLKQEASAYLRLNKHMVQHVADYIEGELVSDSLAESCLIRLLGMRPIPAMLIHEREAKQSSGKGDKPRISRPGFFQDMVSLLQQKGEKKFVRQQALSRLQQERTTETRRLVCLIIDWVEWMLEVNALSPSTCAMHLTNLLRGLLPSISSLDIEIATPDDWEILVENMLRQTNRYDKLRDAIAKFSDFLSHKLSTRFAHKGYSCESSVNAWCLSKEEKENAIAILRRKYGASEPTLVHYGEQLIELAYYLGTRRWELLGLQSSEVIGTQNPWLTIRPNYMRGLKSDCSERNIPLGLLGKESFHKVWNEQLLSHRKVSPSLSIVEHLGIDIKRSEKKLFQMINASLQEAAGSQEVSFHTLRHSAACRMMLAIYWPFLGLKALEVFPYFAEIANASETIRNVLLRNNTKNFLEHKSISTALGHLSYRTTAGHYLHHYCLLRLGLLNKVHEKNSWLDSAETLIGLCGRTDLTGRSPEGIVSIISAAHSARFHSYVMETPKAEHALTAVDESFRLRLRVISELAILPQTEQESRLREFISDEDERTRYLKSLQERTQLITEHYTKLGIKLVKGSYGALIMPTDVPAQDGLHAATSLISTRYPASSDCREFSMALLRAASCMAPKENGAFAFKSGDEARQTLEPLMPVLNELEIRFYHWNRVSKRLPGKNHPQIIKENSAYADNLRELPNHRVGTLIVRIEPKAGTATYTPRLLIWLIAAMYAAYGRVIPSICRGLAA